MIEYRFLTTGDLASLRECFLAAFSDYEVDLRMSREQFEQRIARDGVRLEMSVGAFDAGRMVGFCINGVGSWQETKTAYDAGTGVIPNYRGKGVGKQLFAFMTPLLKEMGIEQYLLEVLSSNVPALSLYRKLGFVDTRMLAVFRRHEPQKSVADQSDVSIRRVAQADWLLFQSFWDAEPSWQNSAAAVDRVANETTIIGAFAGEECVGYGVVFLPSANQMQLAVVRTHRRQGVGSRILSALESEAGDALKVNNIDETLSGTLAFYQANGFKLVLRQHEMIKKL